MQPYFCFSHLGFVIKPKILVFGFSGAPYYFNKIVREVMKFIRTAKIKAAAYFDDLLFVLKKNKEEESIHFAKELLNVLGWMTNDKSIWEMTKRIEYLGVIIDSVRMKLFVSESKKKKIKQILEEVSESIRRRKSYQLGKMATLLGKLSWASVGVRGIATWTRALDHEKNEAVEQDGWEDMEKEIRVVDERRVEEELKFWEENLDKLVEEGNDICQNVITPKIVLETDASETGWGAKITGVKVMELAGTVTKTEKDSSTLREIMAVKEALEKGKEILKGNRVEVRIDSQALSHILKKENSKKTEINDYMKAIWENCRKEKIDLEIKWIPREENKEADALSRVFQSPSTEEQKEIEKIAERNGIKTCRAAESGKYLMLKPDQNYIPKAIKIVQVMKQEVALIVPEWRSALWWPMIQERSRVKCKMNTKSEKNTSLLCFLSP
jgi:hypothetical protein